MPTGGSKSNLPCSFILVTNRSAGERECYRKGHTLLLVAVTAAREAAERPGGIARLSWFWPHSKVTSGWRLPENLIVPQRATTAGLKASSL